METQGISPEANAYRMVLLGRENARMVKGMMFLAITNSLTVIAFAVHLLEHLAF